MSLNLKNLGLAFTLAAATSALPGCSNLSPGGNALLGGAVGAAGGLALGSALSNDNHHHSYNRGGYYSQPPRQYYQPRYGY